MFYTSFCIYNIVVSDDIDHFSTLASVELEKRENRDDIDFLQMNGYVPCGIISIVFNLKKNRMARRHTPFF